jgi:hypothetical protein
MAAMAKKSHNSFLIPATKAQKEARAFFKADDEVRSRSKTLLNPDEVAGEYDAGRMLMTTLGGKLRMLTVDDLAQLRHNIRQVKQKYKKGITAKQVIDLSWRDDRERANKEIRTAIPISNIGGLVRFVTNSGPNSDRQRHYVEVRFLNFDAVAASAIKIEKTGAELAKGYLHIGCSCGRWRYWFAYVANIGGYAAGHRETAAPKIRNPGMTGVACKHILRVMASISQSPSMKSYLTMMVRAARGVAEAKARNTKLVDARDLAEQMKGESYRQRKIATTEEKRAQRAKWESSKPVIDLKAKAAAKVKSKSAKQVAKAANAVEANIKKLLALGAINQGQADAMLAALSKK